MDFIETSYNDRAQWEGVQSTRTVTLPYPILELCPFVKKMLFCPEHNSVTSEWILMKLYTMIEQMIGECSAQEP